MSHVSFNYNNRDQRFIPPKEVKKILGISDSTLRRWAQKKTIEFVLSPSGHRLYRIPEAYKTKQVSCRQKICYARVSTQKQAPDLDHQVAFLKQKFPDHRIITDIGSSLNWHRKGLNAILDSCFNGDVQEIVVANRDRLSRFAFELLQNIFDHCQVKLVVLDSDSKTESEELADDVLSIIITFSAKYYGKRKGSYKIQKNQNSSD